MSLDITCHRQLPSVSGPRSLAVAPVVSPSRTAGSDRVVATTPHTAVAVTALGVRQSPWFHRKQGPGRLPQKGLADRGMESGGSRLKSGRRDGDWWLGCLA